MSDQRSGTALESPWILDLFCREGGAAAGYKRAGFSVLGVDKIAVSNYAGDSFVQADALDVLRLLLGEHDGHETIGVLGLETRGNREGFLAAGDGGLFNAVDADHVFHAVDSPKPALPVKCLVAVHASPPCQAHTAMQAVAQNAEAHEDLIGPTRDLLERLGLPYVIENVEGAKPSMRNPVILCGSAFGLGALTDQYGWLELRRHRLFETNWPILVPPCQHRGRVIGIYGDHARSDRRHGAQSQFSAADGLRYGREAMQMPWASWDGLREAIPPAYTEFLGSELLRQVEVEMREAERAGIA